MPLKGGVWVSDWAWANVAIRTRVSEAVRARLTLKEFCRVMRYSKGSDEPPLSPMEAWGCTRTLRGEVSDEGDGRLRKGFAREPALCGLEENWSIAGRRYGDLHLRYSAADLHVQEEAFKVAIGETGDDDGAYSEESKP